MILLVAEMHELTADYDANPEGVVIEAELDKGKGAVATVIVQQGTLRRGDVLLFETTWGRVRAMIDHLGRNVNEVTPSMPAEILGLEDVPQPGERFVKVEDEFLPKNISSQSPCPSNKRRFPILLHLHRAFHEQKWPRCLFLL